MGLPIRALRGEGSLACFPPPPPSQFVPTVPLWYFVSSSQAHCQGYTHTHNDTDRGTMIHIPQKPTNRRNTSSGNAATTATLDSSECCGGATPA